MQLNREQRRRDARAASRQPRRLQRAIPAHIGAEVQRVIIESFSAEPVSQAERQALMLPAYAKLELLVSGGLDTGGYYDISRAVVFGIYLGSELAHTATAEHKETLHQHAREYDQAREALKRVADRYNATGKFGVSGDDLRILRGCLQLTDELICIAEKRHVMRADQRTAYAMTELRRIQAESVAAGRIV